MKIIMLGVGHWHAGMHLDAAISAGADVCGVWDESSDDGSRFAQMNGLPVLESIDEALAAEPDLIVLMGHPLSVPGHASRLIDARVPFVLEKPAAGNTATIAELARQARDADVFVDVPLPNRFGPIFAAHRSLRDADRAGRLSHASFRLVNGPPERYRQDNVAWLLDPEIGGGGALRNLGIHGVDAVLSLAQGPLSIVSSNVANRVHTEEAVEDHALVVLTDAAGTLFTVEAGYTYASMAPGGEFEWRIVTTNATLIDRGDQATCVTLDDAGTRTLPVEPTSTRYRLFMADTLERLRDGRKPAISLEDYLAAMSIIDAAYEKARA